MEKEFYTKSEWDNRILSIGRLVDIRNFPNLAGEVLLGEKPAYLLYRSFKFPLFAHINSPPLRFFNFI